MVTTVVVKLDYAEVVNALVDKARIAAGEKAGGGAKVTFLEADGKALTCASPNGNISVVVEFTVVNRKG